MKITLHINTPLDTDTFLRAAAHGLRSVSDEGEAVIAALEAAAGTALVKRRISPALVAATLEAQGGNVSATSRALGIARSTVRAAVRGAVRICPACNDRLGVCDGYCAECDAEITAEIDGRRGGDEWMPR